jgi:Holliday junction resolvasome RuvABC endonuclease subunit
LDGTVSAYARDFEKSNAGRLCGLAGEIERHNTPECVGVCIEDPFGMNRQACKVLDMMVGVAIVTCERLGLPYSIINVGKVKKHATGKGNAKKPEVQAAALGRWGLDLGEDEADASWSAAYALDHNLFG